MKHTKVDPQRIPQVTKVTPLPNFGLEVTFDSDEKGQFCLQDQLAFTGYFASLALPEFFRQVYIEHGTLCWPNGIDLDPVVVHAWATHLPIELASNAPVYS